MKKWLILSLIAIIIVGAFFASIVYRPRKIAQLEEIVPDKIIYYLYSNNPSKKVEDFYNSAFFQKITGFSWYEKFADNNLGNFRKANPYIKRVFDNDSALAIFSSQLIKSEFKTVDPDIEVEDFLMLARLDRGDNIRKTAAELYFSFFAEKKLEELKYKGVKITEYELPQTKGLADTVLYYAVLADVLILSNNIEIIEESIDLFKKTSETSLANNEKFKESVEYYGKDKEQDLGWFYIDYDNYYKDFLSVMKESYSQLEDVTTLDSDYFDRLHSWTETMQGPVVASSGSFYYDRAKQGLILKGYQLFDKSRDKVGVLDIFPVSGRTSEVLLEMVPDDAIGYYGFCANPEKLFNYLKNLLAYLDTLGEIEAGKTPSMEGRGLASDKLEIPEVFLGINIEKDILPLAGENVGIVFLNIEEVLISVPPMTGLSSEPVMVAFPLPVASLIIEAKDTRSAQALIDLIRTKLVPEINVQYKASLPPAESQAEEPIPSEAVKDIVRYELKSHNGVDVHTFAVTDLPFAPNCFIIDNYVVISTSISGARSIINTQKGEGGSLAEKFNQDFGRDKVLPSSFFTFFLDFNAMISEIMQTTLVSSYKPFVPMLTRGAVTTQTLDEIIDILDDISVTTMTGIMSEDETSESLVYIEIEGL